MALLSADKNLSMNILNLFNQFFDKPLFKEREVDAEIDKIQSSILNLKTKVLTNLHIFDVAFSERPEQRAVEESEDALRSDFADILKQLSNLKTRCDTHRINYLLAERQNVVYGVRGYLK